MPDVTTLTIVVPCFNEEKTLGNCIQSVMQIAMDDLELEIVIVDDASSDLSFEIAEKLAKEHPSIKVLQHEFNQGKGAALRTGFAAATGDFVAVQDADLEYDPMDLRKLIGPLREGDADVVLGSRFRTGQSSRVLYFWHSMGNQFLTLLSNMFTDLNLTDMETCYKVFRREVIQAIEIEENRFGFEPEVVAKVAEMRCRVYEMGISYRGRTYEEGKKIGMRDGFRALYCIIRYNAHKAPLPIQFFFYLFIGGSAAVVNLVAFLLLRECSVNTVPAAVTAFGVAALVNYWLSIKTIFRRNARWNTGTELLAYLIVVLLGASVDVTITYALIDMQFTEWIAKAVASLIALIVNFLGRRIWVFPETPRGPWQPTQSPSA